MTIPWDDIDSEIRELVRVLNAHGFVTLSSCSGHREARRRRVDGDRRYATVSVGTFEGLEGLHRFMATLNAIDDDLADVGIGLGVSLIWSYEVAGGPDPDDPEWIGLELEVREFGGRRGDRTRDRAPTAAQLAMVAEALDREFSA
jgi:hypothetical protein